MRLDPEIQAKVEAAIGKKVPHPASPEFDEFLQELRGKDPELAHLLESGVVYDEMPFPEEEIRPKVEKREKLRRLRNLLFNRYDPLTGEWVPSRPKQIAVGFTLFLLFFIPFFLIANRSKGSVDAAGPSELVDGQDRNTAQEGLEEDTPPGEEETEGAPPSEAEGATTTSEGEEGGILLDEPRAEVPPPPPPPPPLDEAPPPPSSMDTSTDSPPQQDAPPRLTLHRRTRVAPTLGVMAGSEETPEGAPEAFKAEGGSLEGGEVIVGGFSLYSRKRTLSSYTTSFHREKTSPQLTVHTPKAQEATPSPSENSTEEAGPSFGGGRTVAEDVIDILRQSAGLPSGTETGGGSAGGTQERGSALFSESRTRASGSGFYLYRSTSNPPQGVAPGGQPVPSTGGMGANPGLTAAYLEGGLPPQTGLGGGLPPSVETRGTGNYLPGTRLKGRLPVTLILQEGKKQPVVVEAEDGALFSGEAFLNEVRRVEIHFTSVIKGGSEEPVNAIAVGEDGAYGLPAAIREEAPSLAADLLRGTLRGFSDYLQAATQASSVSIGPGGEKIQERETPPLENFLAAAAAELFSLPQGAKAVVRLAEVKKGIPLSILVLSSSSSPTPPRGPGEP